MADKKPPLTALLICLNLLVFVGTVWFLWPRGISLAAFTKVEKSDSVADPAGVNATSAVPAAAELDALRVEVAQTVAALARAAYQRNADNEISRIMLAAKLPSTRTEYAPFAAKLGLSPTDRERLYTLLAGLNMETKVFVRLKSEDRALLGLPESYKFDESDVLLQIRGMLGEQNYSQFLAYRETIPAREEVREFEEQLVPINLTVDETQREAVVAALVSVTKIRYPSFTDSVEVRDAFFDAQLRRYEEVLRITRGVLSAEQNAVLERALRAKIEAGLRRYKIHDRQRAFDRLGSEDK